MTELSKPTVPREAVDWTRDQWGRPKILPPPGVVWKGPNGRKQAQRGYTRVTTFAGALDDQSNLTRWKIRRALLGMSRRPDYVTSAAALTAEDRDRADLDALAEKCLEAAGPNAADLGTALHGFTERLDRGEELGHVPEQYRADLDAYLTTTRPVLTWAEIECRMVCDEHETAGTPDRLGWCTIPDPDGVTDVQRVIDVKTGRVDYPAKFSTQLAEYAHSHRYDPTTGERRAVELSQRWGLIIELPVGQGACRLHWLNLEHGQDGIALAGPVRAWRKVKADGILFPVAGPPATTPVVTPEVNGTPAPVTGMAEPEAAADAARDAGLARHPYGDSHTGMLCGAMVMRDGAGDQCGLPAGDPVHEPSPEDADAMIMDAIGRLITPEEATGLWQQHREQWGRHHTAAMAARVEHLKAERATQRPRAALLAAVRTAGTAEQLTALWSEHRTVWTDEHTKAASLRRAELASQ